MSERVTTERTTELLDALALPCARRSDDDACGHCNACCGHMGATATLRRVAPDLAAALLDARADLAAERTRREAAEASVAQLRADLERADFDRQRVEGERDGAETVADVERARADSAESRLAAIVGAVRAERECEENVRAATAECERLLRGTQRAFDLAKRDLTDADTALATARAGLRTALDALLAGAPAPAVVPADVVRRYLAALDALPGDSATERTARTALDAALGAT
ncbi:MAG: hypothetical protein Q8S73_37080 [Deltaproteobacteria bacterium]|nr:hypothetical protein [Myxococcales bacterium]MDP3219775.1 hypothetical protein [Deltaproteobacteria bacterium]